MTSVWFSNLFLKLTRHVLVLNVFLSWLTWTLASSESLGILWDISITSTTLCSSRSLVTMASVRLLCRVWISLFLLFMSVSAASSCPWSSVLTHTQIVQLPSVTRQTVLRLLKDEDLIFYIKITLVWGLKFFSLCVDIVEKVLQFIPTSLSVLQLGLRWDRCIELCYMLHFYKYLNILINFCLNCCLPVTFQCLNLKEERTKKITGIHYENFLRFNKCFHTWDLNGKTLCWPSFIHLLFYIGAVFGLEKTGKAELGVYQEICCLNKTQRFKHSCLQSQQSSLYRTYFPHPCSGLHYNGLPFPW